MSILDEAIREHLELKRRHGAEQDELRQLEEEAFGPPERPEAGEDEVRADKASHPAAPGSDAQGGESFDQPESQGAELGASQAEEATRLMDWQQEGPGETPGDDGPSAVSDSEGERTGDGIVEHAGADPRTEADDEERAKREAIARQETEHFDVLSEAGEDHPAPSDDAPPQGDKDETRASEPLAEVPTLEEPPPPPGPERVPGRPLESSPGPDESPSSEQALDREDTREDEPTSEAESEKQAGDKEQAGDDAQATSDEESNVEIFDQKLLADELDQALDVEPPKRRTSFFDDESDEYRVPQRPSQRRFAEETGEFDTSDAEETGERERAAGETGEWSETTREEDPSGPETGEDVLEETPEFLEETPEHDRLWFEQRPPKGFDFND